MVIVGMEKVMIIVRAVVSTPASKPVKIRIAEGSNMICVLYFFVFLGI